MIIFKTIVELKHYLSEIRDQGQNIGFVPTMGALHKGHLSLIEIAKTKCDFVVCSIFVNPTQFNDVKDLKNYPKSFDIDKTLLESVDCNVLFCPEINEIYSDSELKSKEKNEEDKTWMQGKTIDFGSLDKVLEGAHRPGHFNGVAQIVSKLFRIVEPKSAFFGQKDFQQLAIIKSMTKQLEMKIEIITCPIIRESDGLAMSSRNVRLSEEERIVAPLIYKTLSFVKQNFKNKNISELKSFVENEINKEPKMILDYFEIVDAETLHPLLNFNERNSPVACIALKLGSVRLIDNMILY